MSLTGRCTIVAPLSTQPSKPPPPNSPKVLLINCLVYFEPRTVMIERPNAAGDGNTVLPRRRSHPKPTLPLDLLEQHAPAYPHAATHGLGLWGGGDCGIASSWGPGLGPSADAQCDTAINEEDRYGLDVEHFSNDRGRLCVKMGLARTDTHSEGFVEYGSIARTVKRQETRDTIRDLTLRTRTRRRERRMIARSKKQKPKRKSKTKKTANVPNEKSSPKWRGGNRGIIILYATWNTFHTFHTVRGDRNSDLKHS